MVVEVIGVHYKRLRNLREDHDMTQKELARLLDCSQRIYSNYERGCQYSDRYIDQAFQIL